MTFDATIVDAHATAAWAGEVRQALCEHIAIPALSPHFDDRWEANGHLAAAVAQAVEWAGQRAIDGMTVTVQELPGRTPLVVIEVAPTDPARADDTVLLYGHLDKQPEMTGWREGLGPWKPVVEGDYLYGRGGGDDGYSVFCALTAIEALQRAGGRHARLLVLIETSEESGSIDLPAHLEALGEHLGQPSLVICLDGGVGDHQRLWTTTSLRGLVSFTLRADIVQRGLHSGSTSGIAASSFRILRTLLSRVEDERTGQILIDALHVPIPPHRLAEAAATVPDCLALAEVPLVAGARPVSLDPVEAYLNSTWRPTLSVIGAEGMPSVRDAGNVLRPFTSLRLSFRLPPTADSAAALTALRAAVTANAPYGATITVDGEEAADGWDAPAPTPWLTEAVHSASMTFFGKEPRMMGEGGSIPFMAMLGRRFPEAQFVVTGVLDPLSGAHGPNEYVYLPTARRLTACVAALLDRHAARS